MHSEKVTTCTLYIRSPHRLSKASGLSETSKCTKVKEIASLNIVVLTLTTVRTSDLTPLLAFVSCE